ncbi:cation:proton antiporter subunit C [Candidatus Tisiphia endosymbiont of Nemotelus uliginosus]|uniref:cation:proton antiporter subunit C n=1 Tax=Candidatus Tisiphia endosymbiont of Nemotelus uliginosus TaxID=3077926 RepID=UPI0035C90D0C
MFLDTLYFSKGLYFLALLVLTAGLFIMLSSDNYVRKIVGLNIMQSSVLIFYLILGKVNGGTVPIERNVNHYIDHTSSTEHDVQLKTKSLDEKMASLNANAQNNHSLRYTLRSTNTKNIDHILHHYQYSSPVPQVLMLTAIVVGFATFSVGLSLIYLISKQFSTISESKIHFTEIEGE